MTRNFQIGILFRCQNPPEVLRDYVQTAEAAGFDDVWLIEDCFWGGGIASAALALAFTSKIHIGLGIMPAVVRNPAFAAMEIATLSRLYPGRFLPGFGHGVADWMKQIGAFPSSQLGALGDIAMAVRALLAGEKVNINTPHVFLDAVQLELPPASPPPIALGVRGIKSLQLSGRVADSTLLAELSAPAYVRWAREQITIGQREAGRENQTHPLTVYAFCAVDPDGHQARAYLRPHVARILSYPGTESHLKPTGLLEPVQAMLAQGGLEYLEKAMPDEWISQLTISGTPEECLAAMHAVVEAGADRIVLMPMDEDMATLKKFAAHLLPLLK